MTIRMFADATGCAIFEEAPGGGDPLNPTSLMNRPFLNPMSWVANILFHSEFNYYGVVASTLSVTITHPAVAGVTTARPYTPVNYVGQSVVYDHLLLNHNEGVVPLFFVAYGGQMLPHGTPTQIEAGGYRMVSAYATATQIRLRDLGVSSASTLPAASRTYQVLVFRSTAKDPALKQLDLSPGAAVLGQGKFQQSQAHLRALLSGDTPFAVAKDRTAAIRNGSLRARFSNGGIVDVGPFNGSLPAPGFINVTAGV
jgi:hypothetical protein